MKRLRVITVLEGGRIIGGFRNLAEKGGRFVGIRLGANSVIPFRRSNPPYIHHMDTILDVVFKEVTLDRGTKRERSMTVLAHPDKHMSKAGFLVLVEKGSVKPNGEKVVVHGYGDYVAFELMPKQTVHFFQGDCEYAITLGDIKASPHPQCTLITDHAEQRSSETAMA